jgi:hypothetical protein
VNAENLDIIKAYTIISPQNDANILAYVLSNFNGVKEDVCSILDSFNDFNYVSAGFKAMTLRRKINVAARTPTVYPAYPEFDNYVPTFNNLNAEDL